jgi:ABC-type nitrate/sulfonate/bicarbonate transport system substrate-binding protein
MLTHDQNPVDPEIKIEGEDTASKSTEVETGLDSQEPEVKEETSATQVEPELAEEAKPELEETTEVVAEATEAIEEVAEEAPAEATEAIAEVAEETPAVATEEIKPVEAEKPKAELSPEEREMEAMLSMYEESFSNFKVGEIIDGTMWDIFR